MDPALFLEVLWIAANAQTDEEKAWVAWRASDYVWLQFPRYPIGFCRDLNDHLQDLKLPQVGKVFSLEEVITYGGFTDLFPVQAPGDSTRSLSEAERIRAHYGAGNGEKPTDT